jgi:hypothetical protein
MVGAFKLLEAAEAAVNLAARSFAAAYSASVNPLYGRSDEKRPGIEASAADFVGRSFSTISRFRVASVDPASADALRDATSTCAVAVPNSHVPAMIITNRKCIFVLILILL